MRGHVDNNKAVLNVSYYDMLIKTVWYDNVFK